MDDHSLQVRTDFIRIVDGLVVRLHDPLPADASERDLPGLVTNLGHRISDTLPSDLAEQLEEVLDELLTLAQPVWLDGETHVSALPNADDRLDRLARRWTRLKRNLLPD